MGCNKQFIKQGTTVPVSMTFSGDFSAYEPVVSFRTAAGVIDKTEAVVEYDAESDATTISVLLTQEDTLSFDGMIVEMDMRAAGPDGDVIGVDEKPVFGISESINKDVLGD